MHHPPLHLRRHLTGLFLDRHDAAGVNRLAFFLVEDPVLRVGDLPADRPAKREEAGEELVLAGAGGVLGEGRAGGRGGGRGRGGAVKKQAY
mgnify:CR=1 FL=1